MKNIKGVSLFEIMISLIILGSVFCALFASLFFGKKVSLDHQDRLIAAALARGVMEEMSNQIGVNTMTTGFVYPPPLNVVIDNVQYTINVNPGESIGTSNVRSASIIINWNERQY